MEELELYLTNLLGKEKTKELFSSFDNDAYSAVRINKIKTDVGYIKNFFDLKKETLLDYGFIFDKKNMNLGKNIYHKAGLYYIQEPSAMYVGSLLDVKETDKVLDLCAAPGGKSTHIAMKMNNKGLVVSNDVGYNRATELSYNIERMGLSNCLVTSMDADFFASSFEGYFDKVILDAPCSGLGMIRKNDLSKTDWNINKVNKLSTIQKDLILKAYKCLKKDGVLLYSTCTFTKEENEEVIQYLLDNTNASIIPVELKKGIEEGFIKGSIRIYPSSFEGEGHFACMIQCNDDHKITKKYPLKETNYHTVDIYRSWEKDNLNCKLEGFFVNFDGHLYLLNNPLFNLDKIKVLRAGLYLGEIIKNRFVPSHSLAMFLKKEDFKQVLLLDNNSNEIDSFLKGMTLAIPYQKNYVLVCIDGFPIGLGKADQGILKNLLPKGLRL